MKYKYIGRPGMGETAYLDPEDVVIEQQHCGGETIKVYHGLLVKQQNLCPWDILTRLKIIHASNR